MKKRFSEEQIIGILKEAEAGAVVTELCRRHGMSSATYYAWKAKFGGQEHVRRGGAPHQGRDRRACVVAERGDSPIGLGRVHHPADGRDAI